MIKTITASRAAGLRSPSGKRRKSVTAQRDHAAGNQAAQRRLLAIDHDRQIETRGKPRPDSVLQRAVGDTQGQALPSPLRSDWESRLGEDLSGIRLHTGSATGAAVADSGANAINYGNHIFFAPGRYDPAAPDGQRLLGHEIVHGLQSRLIAGNESGVSRRPGTGRQPHLEAEAQRIGTELAYGRSGVPLEVTHRNAHPAFRGDKQITFSNSDITVRDTYVLYGESASPEFVERFRNALDRYYNDPHFEYRGYTVHFQLTVRAGTYRTRREMGKYTTHEIRERATSGFDPSSMIFDVESGAGRAGGLFTIGLYETSNEGTIAHEVGHYLSDRVGYFSEGYTEGFFSRLGSAFGIRGSGTTPKPEAVGDIMASSQTGVVSEFSLSGILDNAIDEHEEELRKQESARRFREDLRTVRGAFAGDIPSTMRFMRMLSGM